MSGTQTVYCADACAEVYQVEHAYGHVMIVDPPYSEHVHANAVSQSTRGGVRVRDLGFEHLTDDLRATIARQAAMVPRWSLVYSDIEGLHEWRKALVGAGAQYIRTLPWVRWSMPQLSGDRPPSGCEMLTIAWGAQTGKKSWNGPGNLIGLDHKCLRGEGKHKTEKPLDQMLDLVSWFSDPGETIVDLTAGSGTTGLACKILGRNFTGFEIDPEWAAKANTRIASDILSERDAERYARWQESQVVRAKEAARIDANTARVRAQLDAKKAVGS